MKRLLLAPIAFYRRHLSALKGSPCCRFSPTCSAYAYHAICEWGAVLGLLLGILRLLRCNPLFKGGIDDVPRIPRRLIPKTKPFGRGARVFRREIRYPYLTYYGKYL